MFISPAKTIYVTFIFIELAENLDNYEGRFLNEELKYPNYTILFFSAVISDSTKSNYLPLVSMVSDFCKNLWDYLILFQFSVIIIQNSN